MRALPEGGAARCGATCTGNGGSIEHTLLLTLAALNEYPAQRRLEPRNVGS